MRPVSISPARAASTPATMNVPHSTRATRTPATRAAAEKGPPRRAVEGPPGDGRGLRFAADAVQCATEPVVAQKQAEHDVQDRGDPDGHGDAYPLAGAEIQIPTWKVKQRLAAGGAELHAAQQD